MAAVTICSDFGAPKNKVWHCFQCFPIYFLWSDGTRCHDRSSCHYIIIIINTDIRLIFYHSRNRVEYFGLLLEVLPTGFNFWYLKTTKFLIKAPCCPTAPRTLAPRIPTPPESSLGSSFLQMVPTRPASFQPPPSGYRRTSQWATAAKQCWTHNLTNQE